MTNTLEFADVSKRYVGHLAVDRLSVAVPAGTIYGVLGPNGAGKSTSLRMAMNIIARDSGTIRLLGADPARDPAVLRRVGYLPEERGLYKKMTALDAVVFFGALRGMTESDAKTAGARWLETMGLGQWQQAKIETLSKGMQQKVQFVTTVVHGPELLILDEPASGLDPVNQEVLRDTILGAKKDGRTVVFSTHNMDQAEQLCDSVCIIASGRKVLDGDLRDIRRGHAGRRYRLEFDEVTPAALAFIDSGRFAGAERSGNGWTFELPTAADVHATLSALAAAGLEVAKFEHVKPSLHEIFVSQVGHAEIAERRPEVTNA